MKILFTSLLGIGFTTFALLGQVKHEENNHYIASHSQDWFEFYKELHSFNEFDQIANFSRKLLCMWGSTYCCEQFFSCMKNIKTAERNRLSDCHLTNILRIKTSTIKADIEDIIKGRQCQKSH